MDDESLVVAVRGWLANQARLDEMICEWQALEDKLSQKARELEVSFVDACQGDMPEAKEMRALDRKITSSQRNLTAGLAQVRSTQSVTLVGAIAKIRLGLKVQGKYDWQDNALELIETAVDEMELLSVHRND